MNEVVRSVQRALMLIRLMNRRDSWSLQEIAERTALAKPTAHRLLHTLIDEGYVHLAPGKAGMYRLTSKVRELGAGLTAFTIYADLADPVIVETTRKLQWPVSFAMPAPPFMRIVSCGMPYIPDHSAKPTSVGREHWMFQSAVGGAYLSRCSKGQIARCHQSAVDHRLQDGDARPVLSIDALLRSANEVRETGYALRFAKPSDVNSTMAVPVYKDDWAIGAIACSTFPHSLSSKFIQEMLPGVKAAADEIAIRCLEAA